MYKVSNLKMSSNNFSVGGGGEGCMTNMEWELHAIIILLSNKMGLFQSPKVNKLLCPYLYLIRELAVLFPGYNRLCTSVHAHYSVTVSRFASESLDLLNFYIWQIVNKRF